MQPNGHGAPAGAPWLAAKIDGKASLMPLLSTPASTFYVVSIAALLGFAAWRDVVTRTIPDGASIALLLVGSLLRASQGWQPLLLSWFVAVVIFVLLIPLCARGLMGGADLKLLSALAVGLPPQTSLQLLLDVTLCGGLLAAIYLGANKLLRRMPSRPAVLPARSMARRIVSVEFWRIRRGAPLPYGIAIAAGAAIAVLKQQGV